MTAKKHLSEQFGLVPVLASESPLIGGRLYHGAWGRHNGDILNGTSLDVYHFGTRGAALDRLNNTYDPDGSEDATVWSAGVRPGATVYPEPLTDAEQFDLQNSVEFGGASLPADVVPYMNEFEDPGSLSFMVRRNALTRLRPHGY